MILFNKTEGLRKLLLPSLILLFLIGGTLNWSGCKGDGVQTADEETPGEIPEVPEEPEMADPLEEAKAIFRDNVFPFFNHDRCVNCHDFTNQIVPGGSISVPPFTHSASTNCTSCHTPGLVGVPDWMKAPANTQWVKDANPDEIREQIITLKGELLFNHLIGEMADADLFVQWGLEGSPDNPNFGKVPGGGPNNGTITDLLKWDDFKLAVQKWICAEADVPGSQDLGKPDTLDCSTL